MCRQISQGCWSDGCVMVKIQHPPPNGPSNPKFCIFPQGQSLRRIHKGGVIRGNIFRFKGPYSRFDHHINEWRDDRGVSYFAPHLTSCLVEVFGDSRIIMTPDYFALTIIVNESLELLDLRGNGAMLAGTVAAVSSHGDYEISQHWSRYFYEFYPHIDGLIYANAHNQEDAIVLYERCRIKVDEMRIGKIALGHSSLRRTLLEVADQNNLILMD